MIIEYLLLFLTSLSVLYLWILALASVKPIPKSILALKPPLYRFIIVIPAHNEENVIRNTINKLRQLNYPVELFTIHVIADHCTDNTVIEAKEARACVHERNDGLRSGKGEVLSWFLNEICKNEICDAVVIFDADTLADENFLTIMNSRLCQGEDVIQGQHRIRNPESGWFPALVWAMFIIDNRFQNLGRTNLGFSAKNMGDSICFRFNVLCKMGWGQGLTEDYQLRFKLILEGIKIRYEPRALGWGEAPTSWGKACNQRLRWLRGAHDTNKKFSNRLILEGLKRGQIDLLDGAFQLLMPSYSTLVILCVLALMIGLFFDGLIQSWEMPQIHFAWIIFIAFLYFYPFLGLVLEHAPFRAYLAIFTGPLFIVWRSFLAIKARFLNSNIPWIRTTHGKGA